MATDHSLQARRGVVERLKADASIAVLVGNRVYGPKVPSNPTFPFIRVGLMISAPFSPSQVSGMDASFNIDCNSKRADEGEAAKMSNAVVASLNIQNFALTEDASTVRCRWIGTNMRYENPIWRAMTGFRLTTQTT